MGADGRAWAVAIGNGHIERIDNVDHLVMSLALTPPGGHVTDFTLRYDVIAEQLVTHKVIAADPHAMGQGDDHARSRNARDLRLNTTELRVDGDGGSWLHGFAATAGLGVEHIGEGADHLLVLLMLLIPAPLVAAGGRCHTRASVRRKSG